MNMHDESGILIMFDIVVSQARVLLERRSHRRTNLPQNRVHHLGQVPF